MTDPGSGLSMGGAGFKSISSVPFVYEVQSPAPAAGSGASITTPADSICQMVYVEATLTTSGTVVNRGVTIRINDGVTGINFYFGSSNNNQAASSTLTYIVNCVPISPIAFNRVYFPLPSQLLLQPSTVVTLSADNFQAGDQFTNCRFVYRRFKGTRLVLFGSGS